MAKFNIENSLSNGTSKRIDWLALPGKGETAQQVVEQVRDEAAKRFGAIVKRFRWTHVAASNGYITVQMHA